MNSLKSAYLLALFLATTIRAAPVESFLEAKGPTGPLKGTLLGPTSGEGPVGLIIPGSGPTDRDGNSPMGIKASTYRLLAEGLAARGIRTVRIDKRGMFASMAATPDANAVTIPDYVDDVRSWVATIRQHTGAPCVWLIGHSEGGLVALASAPQLSELCGLILIASPGRTAGELLREQLKANPANAPLLEQAMHAIDALEAGKHVDTENMDSALMPLFAPAVQSFLISEFSYDPARLIASIKMPVLILQGQRDLQVNAADAGLLKKSYPAATLALLPNVNHMLKSVASDDRQANFATYFDPGLPLGQGVVEVVTTFLSAHNTPTTNAPK